MPEITRLHSGSPFEETLSYSRAVVVDNWIFVSNTAGRDYVSRRLSEDAAEQTEQVFKNIEGSLAALGASLKDVVRSRVCIPYLEHKRAILDVIAAKYRGILPASTIVSGPLGNPDFKIEIEVTAYRGAGSSAIKDVNVILSQGGSEL